MVRCEHEACDRIKGRITARNHFQNPHSNWESQVETPLIRNFNKHFESKWHRFIHKTFDKQHVGTRNIKQKKIIFLRIRKKNPST